MDIAFWVDANLLSCEAPFLRHLVMGLKAEGQTVTFIAPHGLDISTVPVLGSRVLTYKSNRWERLPILQKFRLGGVSELLTENPPDVLIAWGSADHLVLQSLALALPALPIILWCWDAAELFSPLLKLPTLKHIVASSTAIASRSTSTGTVPVTVVRPGVYCEDTIACFDVDGQLPCIVSLDPLANRHAYEELIRGCRMLADGDHEFMFFAYDTGREEYPIWRLAEQLKILDRWSFVPFQQDAEPLLLHGDLYIHVLASSRVQYRTLEAMGRGLAVVTLPNHGADYFHDGETCRIIETPTREAWRDILLEMMQQRTRTAALARRAQAYVREHHSMGRMVEQFGSICRQVAGVAIPLG